MVVVLIGLSTPGPLAALLSEPVGLTHCVPAPLTVAEIPAGEVVWSDVGLHVCAGGALESGPGVVFIVSGAVRRVYTAPDGTVTVSPGALGPWGRQRTLRPTCLPPPARPPASWLPRCAR